MGGGLIAGIAGINKTIAIASILQSSDLTYAIYKLNTWVLTEMWFIIIFGSIPTLRPFFVRFTQDIRSAAGFSSRSSGKRSTGRGYLDDSREQNQAWVPLNEQTPKPWSLPGNAVTCASRHSAVSKQDAGIEASGKQILVTKKTTITSEAYQGRLDNEL
ncbi:hypothetical protein N7540_012444 [Penicillium herquei]|nr:hypothetical protein N7540_012444 [Penicillium herquei]